MRTHTASSARAVEAKPIAVALIRLTTGAINPVTGRRTYQVVSAINGEHLATLVWRDFALESGWQCRFAGDRRTLRKTYATPLEALTDQGCFARHAAIDALANNADARGESS